jgi:hypothetical protein
MITAQGIRPRFPSIKAYLKSHLLGITDHEALVSRLSAYGAGRETTSYDVVDAKLELTQLSVNRYWHAIHAALSGAANWQIDWHRAASYQYWANCMNYAWHLHALEEFKNGKRSQQLSLLFLGEFGFCIGNCTVLGWFEYAKRLTRMSFSAIDKGFFSDGTPVSNCCRVQYFVLRLLNDWQNKSSVIMQDCAQGEPIYDAILEKWRTQDPNLDALLLAACDRHTHQARYNNNREYFELSYDNTWYVPFEVLSVFRLRESLGLSIPALDHPLLNTPLGKLPSVSEPYMDETLRSVLKRVAQQLPQFAI